MAKKAKGKKKRQTSTRKSVQRKEYQLMPSEHGHVHCYHTEEVAHTRADICCRCGQEKPVGAPGTVVGT